MLKEIMLASAISFAPNNYPQVNLNNVGNEIDIDFASFDLGSFSKLVINVNTGYMFCCNLEYNGSLDEIITYQVLNRFDYARCDFYNYGDYLQSGLHKMGYNLNSDFSNLYFYVDGPVLSFDGNITEDIAIPCFFAVPGEDDSTLWQISETNSFLLGEEYFSLEFNDFYSNDIISSDNLYLVFDMDDIAFSSSNDRLYFFSLFIRYNSFYIADLSTNYTTSDALTFSQFIYEDENNLRNLLTELISENEELTQENEELIQENEELNSKHALSSVFEIVRGAIDGVVNFLEIELMPNLTIGTIIFVPVVIGVIFFILKALVL